ncbi:MAG: GGDEF domain-containing protein [Desulfocapsaceae bacterium]|nr:GGDEF domain-containing protein [Desulfocapsaceae bacterium]
MNASTGMPPIHSSGNEWQEIDQVLIELNHLKQHSKRLDLLNKLHGRMAGMLGLASMIEAYSVWLMPHVAHELIGYNNTARNKKYLFCSGHGPNRRSAIAFAEQLIVEGKIGKGELCRDKDGHYAHKWVFETSDDAGILLILKEGKRLGEEEITLINYSLEILCESLQRGLEYEDLFERASQDMLTGLANRRVFDERIKGMIESARRYKRPLTMLSMDLDHFKDINDTHGHLAGDQVLKSVARVLTKAVRSTDLLVRMGGDEFLLVLDNTDSSSGQVLAERLCRAVDKLNFRADKTIRLGISIGLAQLQDAENLGQWLERADDILYHAKASGRSRVAVK